jgi:hypothetical protein
VNKIIAAFYGLIVLGGLVNGGYNFVQSANDPKASKPDVLVATGGPVAGGFGLAGVIGVAHFIWSNRKGPVIKSGNSVPVTVPEVTGPPSTRIEIHEPDIDLVCVLRGDAAKDSEGRKKIGDVAAHYAAGGGK